MGSVPGRGSPTRVETLVGNVDAQARAWWPTRSPGRTPRVWARPLQALDRAPRPARVRSRSGATVIDVDDVERRATGPTVQPAHEHTLQARLEDQVAAAGYLPRHRGSAQWTRPRRRRPHAGLVEDPFWPVLATRLTHAAMPPARTSPRSCRPLAAQRPLPDEYPAAALWYRLVRARRRHRCVHQQRVDPAPGVGRPTGPATRRGRPPCESWLPRPGPAVVARVDGRRPARVPTPRPCSVKPSKQSRRPARLDPASWPRPSYGTSPLLTRPPHPPTPTAAPTTRGPDPGRPGTAPHDLHLRRRHRDTRCGSRRPKGGWCRRPHGGNTLTRTGHGRTPPAWTPTPADQIRCRRSCDRRARRTR